MKPARGLYAPVARSPRSATPRRSRVREGSRDACDSAARRSSPSSTRCTSTPPCGGIVVTLPLTPHLSPLTSHVFLVNVCSPHSVLPLPLHRPARSGSPGAVGRVHGQQPMLA